MKIIINAETVWNHSSDSHQRASLRSGQSSCLSRRIKTVSSSSDMRGGALLTVMMITLVLSIILASAGYITSHVYRLANRSNLILETTYVAETGLQKIYAEMDAMLTKTNSSLLTVADISTSINTSTAPYNIIPSSKYRFLNYTVLPLASNGVPADISDNTIIDGRQNRFVAVVWVQSLEDLSVVSKLQQEMAYRFEPLFQYGIFFEPDLAIDAGADAIYGGRVHSNGKLRIGNTWDGTTTFLGPVTSVDTPLNNFAGADIYAESIRGYDSVNTNGNIWDGTFLKFKRTVVQSGEPNDYSRFIFSNSPPAKVTERKLPGSTNMSAGSYSTNVTGNGNLVTNLIANNPNASPNGAIELIQRPNYAHDDPYNKPLNDNDPNTRMFYKADLRVIVGGSGAGRTNRFFTGTADSTKPNGDEITLLLPEYVTDAGGTVVATNYHTNQTYLLLNSAFNPNGQISDYRWNNTTNLNGEYTGNNPATAVNNVRTIDFDVSKIVDANGNLTNAIVDPGVPAGTSIPYSPLSDFNGIVYVSNVDGSSTAKTGLKILNGEKLPNNVIVNGVTNRSNLGMTIVTDNPLYLVGDYNTGATGTAVPNNATGNSQKGMQENLDGSTVAGYTRRPAAIMSDAFYALSSEYLTKQNQTNYENRTPVHTTMNLAILTGTNPDILNNSRSEGVGNLPRFMENWGFVGKSPKVAQKLVLNGSIVNIFHSEQSKNLNYAGPDNLPEPWKSIKNNFKQYYQPPVRAFNYDPRFDDPNNLPPGTPVVLIFDRSQWAKVP